MNLFASWFHFALLVSTCLLWLPIHITFLTPSPLLLIFLALCHFPFYRDLRVGTGYPLQRVTSGHLPYIGQLH
jgi:hypothetical protein